MSRPIWSGSIAFGLVNVPVKAFPAVRDHDVHFHQVDRKSHKRIRYAKMAGESRRQVDADDIVMSFDLGDGRHVTFDSAELDAIRPRSTKTVDVTDFVALADIDPVYYERTYWLAPDGDSAARPYQLLRAATGTRCPRRAVVLHWRQPTNRWTSRARRSVILRQANIYRSA